LSLRLALDAWPAHASAAFEGSLLDLARRLRLGLSVFDALDALEGTGMADTLRSIADVHLATGGDAAGLLDAAADGLEQRAGLLRDATTSVAGQRLSGKLVGALPFAFLVLLPAGGGWRFDRRGSLLVVVGAGLLLAGMAWIGRLMPSAPGTEPAADLAELAAAALRAGAPIGISLDVCSRSIVDLGAEIGACRRRTRLGASWSRSLGMAIDPNLVALAGVVRRSEELGTPIEPALRAFARERRRAAEAVFEAASRRAPILMVLPLVLCVLPSFVLLGLAPFLRGLSINS
jgi:tight adherence protein B